MLLIANMHYFVIKNVVFGEGIKNSVLFEKLLSGLLPTWSGPAYAVWSCICGEVLPTQRFVLFVSI